MNRRDRRAARKRGAIFVDLGRLSERDQNFGLPVACYVCDTPHKAEGLARIRRNRVTIDVPLCERCLVSDDGDTAVIRKYLNAPGLEINRRR